MKGRKTNEARNEKYIQLGAFAIAMALCFAGIKLPAQNLIDPVSGSLTTYTAINSDYGPRNVTSGSNPHIGIDYHLPEGGKAYAVSGGTIQNICLTCTTPYIKIGDWRYIHMCVGESPNRLWHATTTTLSNGTTIPIIFLRNYFNGSLATLRALTATNPGTQVHDPITNTYLNTHNTISPGDWVFTSDALNHLHIDYNPNGMQGWENPLKYIRHLDNSAPVSMIQTQRIANGNAAIYTDSISYGHPFILCSESNVITEKDLDKVSFSTTPEGGVKKLIRSWHYSQHGLQGVPIRVKNTQSAILIAADSGIYPAPGYVSLDYLKHYFYSRAKADGLPALCALEAHYPDGYHTLELLSHDVTSHLQTQTQKIILDNFKPFVREVSITTDKLLYSASAVWDAATQQLIWMIQSTGGSFATGYSDALLSIKTSEPMKSMTVSLGTGQVQAWGHMQVKNTVRTEWEATIPQSVLLATIQAGAIGFQALVFNGIDRAGNTLFVPNFPGPTSSYLIPRRNNDGSWSVPGNKALDDNHGFYLKEGPTGNTLNAEFVASACMGTSPLSVQFTDASSGNPSQYLWQFGNGSISASKFPGAITYINNGNSPQSYSISLKVKDANGNENTEYKVHYITVFPAGNPIDPEASFTFVQYGLGAPSYVNFINESKGDQLSYYWDFDDGATSTSQSPSHTFAYPGYYDVSLSITDKNGNTDSQERTVFVYPAISGNVNVSFTVNEPAIACEFIKFNDLTTGVPMAARKFWDFGDGVQIEVLGTPIHLYYLPGTYQVRLEVRDYLDNILGACCKMVTIIPNSLSNLNTDFNQIKAFDGATAEEFGRSVAINGDWIFVGAPMDNDKGSESGSVYAYRLKADSTYDFSQKILAANGKPKDYFGFSISSDGRWLVIGGYQNANYGQGRVWFFEYDGSQWVERHEIGCPVPNRYFFGWSVRMKGDLTIVGAPGGPSKSAGMAVIYRKGKYGWNQEAILFNSTAGSDNFGRCVAIDGEHAMVTLVSSSGDKVRFYRYDGKQWALFVDKSVIDVQSIALECPAAVIGDTWKDRVSMYRYNGNTWYFEGYIYPEDGVSPTDDFGYDVAISGDYLLVGTINDVTTNVATGSAYLFRKDYYGIWQQHLKLQPDNGDNKEFFGSSVALSASHAIAGAFGWKAWRGSAYSYPYVTDPCDRKIRLCDDVVQAGEDKQGESYSLEYAGPGCFYTYEPGSRASYFSKFSVLQDGFTAEAGSEVTIKAVNCYYASSKSGEGCSCTGSPVTVSTNTSEVLSIHIYPNPASDQAWVEWGSFEEEAEMRVYTQDGRLLLHRWVFGEKERISTGLWAPGVYFVEVRTPAWSRQGRMLKSQ